MFFKKHFSKKKKKEFAQKMNEIDSFCSKNGIVQSKSSDSYYFHLNGKYYRVSNHSVEASYQNSHGQYHRGGRDKDVIYIHAGKTRIMDIYKALSSGKEVDGRGYIKNDK